ncbi:M24 family metallopeptidase [Campylobacter sp. JMF_06 NA1]|uniref:M24 family metallopeptidase n=1 Tax=Campylobacter sp. JMF_06 NA1 TaxID=2983823 RepID=UPI0022E9C342|nr:M24 family metallopeptidase [Campylobacter sp. JMF_06 NA1]MDA3078710.1 M24 family metallopeptidase [Campylobacter sp. JMF_06 NA1]
MNYILRDTNAVFWECGYACDNCIFLALNGARFFITDARYSLEASELAKNAQIVQSSDLTLSARKILRSYKVRAVIFDPNDFSFGAFNALSKNLKTRFIPKPNFSQIRRTIKSENELEILRTAAKIGASKFDEFAKFVSENGLGMSEKELFYNATLIFKDSGNLALSFEPIVAINQNAAKAHALPSDERLKDGDLLLLDAGVRYKNYCSDRTRTAKFSAQNGINFSKNQNFGDTKKDKIYAIVKEAQKRAINAVKPGVAAREIDKIARDYIASEGFGAQFLHSTGHGVGVDIHELPIISPRSKAILEEGMIFSIEPGIYLQGEFGVRIEDTVIVTKNGCEVMSE